MPYYFIANIKINDETEYKKYIEKSGSIFSKYKGEYIAVDNNPVIIEGNRQYTRIVIIKFKTKEEFDEWYNSREYKEILQHRLSAANCDSILVKGLNEEFPATKY
jgi:uncharacterized protein (DUF1330 family)